MAAQPDLILTDEEEVEFVVTNKSDKDVYFAIIDLAGDGSVNVVYPVADRNDALAPGKAFKIKASVNVPEGRNRVRDNLKLVATQSPVDFTFLNQKAPKDPLDDPLARLLLRAQLKDRNVAPVARKLDGWTTSTLLLEVVRKKKDEGK